MAPFLCLPLTCGVSITEFMYPPLLAEPLVAEEALTTDTVIGVPMLLLPTVVNIGIMEAVMLPQSKCVCVWTKQRTHEMGIGLYYNAKKSVY